MIGYAPFPFTCSVEASKIAVPIKGTWAELLEINVKNEKGSNVVVDNESHFYDT